MLHHIGLSVDEAAKALSNVEVIVIGGQEDRLIRLAEIISDTLNLPMIKVSKERFIFYKVGCVAVFNHGMGFPSISILLHEIFMGLRRANNTKAIFIRVGTCGGIGLEPATMVVTSQAVNPHLEPYYETTVLGKDRKYLVEFDTGLTKIFGSYEGAKIGRTMSANCFYEGQARLDGIFTDYTVHEKYEYLKSLQDVGILNLEMEGVAFGALTRRANYRACMICLVLVDRLKGDVPTSEHHIDRELPLRIIADVIQKKKYQQLSSL